MARGWRGFALLYALAATALVSRAELVSLGTIDIGPGPHFARPIGIAVNPLTDRLYVSDSAPNRRLHVLYSVSRASIATLRLSSEALSAPVVNPTTNRIYLATGAGVELVEGGANTLSLLTNTPVTAIAVHPSLNRVYLATATGIRVLDGASHALLATIPVNSASRLAVNRITNQMYAVSPNGSATTFSIVNLNANTVTVSVPITETVRDLAVHEANSRVYLAAQNDQRVAVLDGTTGALVTRVDLGTGRFPTSLASNSSNNRVYAGSPEGVEVINAGTNTLAPPYSISNAADVAVNETANRVYAALDTESRVAVIDLGASSLPITTISPPQTPGDLAILDSLQKAYVTNSQGTVSIVNLSTRLETATLPSFSFIEDIAANRVTNRVYVSAVSGISVIDGATDSVTFMQGSGQPSEGGQLAVNSVTNRIYAITGAITGSDNVRVINGANEALVTNIPIPGTVRDIAVNTVTNRVYVAMVASQDAVLVIDGVTNTIIQTIVLNGSPAALAVDGTTNRIYVLSAVSSEDVDTLQIINGASGTIAGNVNVTGAALAVKNTAGRVFVSQSQTGTVAEINGTPGLFTGTQTVGARPLGIGVDATTGLVYVANSGSDTISVLADILFTPQQLTFQTTGASAPPAQAITFSHESLLAYQSASSLPANLTVAPAAGTVPSVLQAGLVPAGLTPGIYNHSISILIGEDSIRIPVAINVTGVLAPAPSTLFFSSVRGSVPPPQNVTVTGLNGLLIATPSASWLAASVLPPGTNPARVVVTANPTGLPPGVYTAGIALSTSLASGTISTVPVVLEVIGNLTASPNALVFSSQRGAAPPEQRLNVSGVAGPLNVVPTVNSPSNTLWLSASFEPPGTNPASVVVRVNPAGLATGTYTGLVNLNDASSAIFVPVTFNVVAGLSIISGCPAPATVGTPYSFQLAATGGAGPYRWSLSSGSLPPGLQLDSATGLITGTSSAIGGSFPFTVQVSSSSQNGTQETDSISCGLEVIAPPITIISACPTTGASVGVPYFHPLSVLGGDNSTEWSISSGALPPGLTLTGANISGTPTQVGQFGFTLSVSVRGQSATQRCSINVVAGRLQVTSGCPAPTGRQGLPYGPAALAASGGQGPGTYSFSVEGTLPAGVSLSGATIGGTPTAPGVSSFRVQVRSGTETAQGPSCTITIAPAPLRLTGVCPTASSAGTSLSLPVSVTGGVAPYRFSLAGPSWLTLTPGTTTATASGVPPEPGRFAATVTVTDSAESAASSFTCDLTVDPAPLTITGACPTAPSPVRTPISVPLSVSGGQGTVRWSLSGPSWLALSTAEGRTTTVAGTPDAAGTFAFTVTATDGVRTQTFNCSITVDGEPLVLTGVCPTGPVQLPARVSVSLTASGGRPPYLWSIAGSPYALSSTTGTSVVAAGTPPAGASTFNVTVRDEGTRQSQSLTCSITALAAVIPPLSVTGLEPTRSVLDPVVVGLALADATPAPLQGEVLLTFVPNAFNASGINQVVFTDVRATEGGRRIAFSVAAGERTIPLPQIQQGNVAGVIRVEVVRLEENGRNVLGAQRPASEYTVPRIAPVVDEVVLENNTPNGFDVVVRGYSTPRDLASIRVRLVPRQGVEIEGSLETSFDVQADFARFYSSAQSQEGGSTFRGLRIPIRWEGESNAITGITLTLVNSAGSSTEFSRSR